MKFDAIVIGVSAGGLAALTQLLTPIKAGGMPPIFVVQHMAPDSDDFLSRYLDEKCQLTVVEALMAMPIKYDHVYIAPANYHLVIGNKDCIELDMDKKVGYSRPSIDVLFQSASFVYGSRLLALVLTGANSDGANGAKQVYSKGGQVIVQNPAEAYSDIMPTATINALPSAQVLSIVDMVSFLNLITDVHYV